ncbi:MAG TPA: hypothetical protein VGK00_02220 [Anaerolineales bacterium]
MKRIDNIHPAFRLPVLILVAALVVTGCNLPVGQAAATPTLPLPFPTRLETSAPLILTPTEMSLPPASTVPPTQANTPPTAVPPTAVPPTAPPPQPTSIPGAIRINFAAGATAGVIEKEIQPGQVINYLVGAAAAQPLMLTVTSPNKDVIFSVKGLKDGKVLVPASMNLSAWQTMLTVTQDYLIQLTSLGSSAELFTLNVITPARVNFDPGSDTTLLLGSTPGGWNVSYVLRARAGQRMDLNLYAPDGNAVLSIYGYEDGQPYLRYVVEQTTFGFKLPATQDYIIQVVPRAGAVANYSLSITIN